ncbi:trehalose 6-phosphatase [Bosea sp. BK604]|nr:trehalose 6-phosphatase [Bosea sp. BK604]
MMDLIEPESGNQSRDFAGAAQALALFLDFDGTLVELAPLPDQVKIDRRVGPALEKLHSVLGGALALVSGRPISVLDDFLAPHRFDIAGLHGAQVRLGGALRSESQAPAALRDATRELVRFANSHVGIIVEDKRISVALHWRLAPQLEEDALALMRDVAARMGPSVRLQQGKSVAELVPAEASKGGAIAWLMQEPPYLGRVPVFIGDDITDEAGFETVNALGGLSIRIGEGKTCATQRLASPTVLRTILLDAAESGSLTPHAFSQG